MRAAARSRIRPSSSLNVASGVTVRAGSSGRDKTAEWPAVGGTRRRAATRSRVSEWMGGNAVVSFRRKDGMAERKSSIGNPNARVWPTRWRSRPTPTYRAARRLVRSARSASRPVDRTDCQRKGLQRFRRSWPVGRISGATEEPISMERDSLATGQTGQTGRSRGGVRRSRPRRIYIGGSMAHFISNDRPTNLVEPRAR